MNINKKLEKSKKIVKQSKAQGMLEFALILPLLLALILGIFEFSRLMFAWIMIENSTRFGIRYATTGNFDETYCPVGGCTTDALVDDARIPSIKDETRRIIIGFFLRDFRTDNTVTTGDELYFNTTVCSGADGRVFTPPVMGSTTYASCRLPNGTSSDHPGAAGERVVVAADYNFSFMVIDLLGLFNSPGSPFGSQPPMIHLASYREGIVEQFRATRAINTPLPLNLPTVPTNTPLPTATFTPTLTFTPTFTPSPTPMPSCDNIYINRVRLIDDNFEARVVNNNFADAHLVNAVLEWTPPLMGGYYFNYANFMGSNYYTTDHFTSPVSIASDVIMPGLSTETWTGDFNSNDISFAGTFTVTLTFNFPNSGLGNCVLTDSPPTLPTLTPTATATNTPVPSCALINVGNLTYNSNNVQLSVTNNNSVTINLTKSITSWSPTTLGGGNKYTQARWDGSRFGADPVDTADSTAATLAQRTSTGTGPLTALNTATFQSRFLNSTFTSAMTVNLTFNIPGIGDCPFTRTIAIPTPTNTPRPTRPAPPTAVPSATRTPAPPTATSAPRTPTNTSRPPTNTSVPPTNTPRPPTNTPRPPSPTPVPPTPTLPCLDC